MPTSANVRMSFDKAKAILASKGVNTNAAILSQSFLRTELQATTTTTNYQFGLLVNQNPMGTTPFNTEQRLNINDVFVCNRIGIFVAKPSSSTDTTFSLDTYPVPSIYSTANTASSLNTLYYNGKLSLTLDNRNIVTAWDVRRHLVIPETQSNTPPTGGVAAKDQKYLCDDGFYPIEPIWFISGTSNVNLNITLPAALTAVESNERIVVILDGFLSQNSTVVRSV